MVATYVFRLMPQQSPCEALIAVLMRVLSTRNGTSETGSRRFPFWVELEQMRGLTRLSLGQFQARPNDGRNTFDPTRDTLADQPR